MNTGYIYLFFAIILGYLSHLFAKKSKGFTNILYGIISIISVVILINCLSKVYNEIPFSLAYITYAVSVILLTTFAGILFYKEKMNMYRIFGTILIIVGIIIIHTIGVQ
jgi:multidrug transporter EmrE-like cation transporter